VTALAGFWSLGGGEDSAQQCAHVLQAQRIYAPDPPAVWSGGDFSMGRRLFRLLPEDIYDRGPVIEEAGERVLVADVRIDNRHELCGALGISAAEARMLSDSTVLMRTLERWDEAAVDRIVGDYAFVLWDAKRRRLLLARDYGGARPLHYHSGKGFFAFASMPKGLHALPQVPIAPDQRSVVAFLALIPETGTETFFEGIGKVPAGHVVTVTDAGIRTRRYWEPTPALLRFSRPEEYEEALQEQLDRAVAARLRGAKGGVAAHLSGGLDSSAVAATAARLLAPSGGRVTAYTAVPRQGFSAMTSDSSIEDEGPLAGMTAALYPNIDHVLIHSSGRSPLADRDRWYFLTERPVLNLCNAVWVSDILGRIREPILLTASAGNMSFSYDGMALLPQLLRRGRLLKLARLSFQLLRNGSRVGTVGAQVFGPFLPKKLWEEITKVRGKGKGLADYTAINPAKLHGGKLASEAASRGLDVSYRPRSDPHELRLWALRRMDEGNYNKGVLGGWGVDMRDPSGDRRLVEFCLSVPPEQFLAGGVPRSLARRAFADRLPQHVVRERRKGYQAADWFEGLGAAREEIGEEVRRLREVPAAAEALDLDRMSSLLKDWPSGDWTSNAVVSQYRLGLLRGASAGHFLRKASGSNQ
jgi:asparagine synthase (glutamine-hydrolysing)